MLFQPEGIYPALREIRQLTLLPSVIKQLLLYDSDDQVNLCQTRSCFSTKPQDRVNEICTLDCEEEWTHSDFSSADRLMFCSVCGAWY